MQWCIFFFLFYNTHTYSVTHSYTLHTFTHRPMAVSWVNEVMLMRRSHIKPEGLTGHTQDPFRHSPLWLNHTCKTVKSKINTWFTHQTIFRPQEVWKAKLLRAVAHSLFFFFVHPNDADALKRRSVCMYVASKDDILAVNLAWSLRCREQRSAYTCMRGKKKRKRKSKGMMKLFSNPQQLTQDRLGQGSA